MKLLSRIFSGFLILLVLAVGALAVVISYDKDCPAPSAALQAEGTVTAVRYYCYGGPEVLQVEQVEKPRPESNQIVIKIQAAGVNPMDWHYMRGSPFIMRLMSGIGAPSEPRLGRDFAGTVETVGSAVDNFKPGDRVFGAYRGAFAQYTVSTNETSVVKIPDKVSFEQAAAIPIAAVTALQALRDDGQLKAGQTVLVNGASGGVGTYAVQIAKSMGAEVDGVCSTRNLELVRSLGADKVIDYKQQDYTQLGKRYDLIVDMVGNHSVLANRKMLKPGGRLVLVGGAKGDWIGPLTKPIAALVIDPFVDETIISMMARMRPTDLQTLADMLSRGEISSVIDRRYTLKDTAEAIAYSETGRARGKIIIDMTL